MTVSMINVVTLENGDWEVRWSAKDIEKYDTSMYQERRGPYVAWDSNTMERRTEVKRPDSLIGDDGEKSREYLKRKVVGMWRLDKDRVEVTVDPRFRPGFSSD